MYNCILWNPYSYRHLSHLLLSESLRQIRDGEHIRMETHQIPQNYIQVGFTLEPQGLIINLIAI